MTLKLYDAQLSPFAARCRMQIYAKNLEAEFLEMPGAISPEDFAALTPMHKVPALDIDGEIIPESQIICEYLEARFPDRPLLPESIEERMRVSLIARIGDLYLMEPMGELFGQINPQGRNEEMCDCLYGEMEKALGWIDFYLDGTAYAVGETLSLADCALMPILFFADRISPMFGSQNAFQKTPNLAAYYEATQKDPVVARVMQELDEALAKMQGR
ncbi:glutathione S-transferase family protein [Tepidicaulis sp. LMO-SS28]|uniref:glutathione S-transferase family protein n=1 Tax=Tepidicaulis sp. LMO-SS28 TaxID=3447455 RepID=UPI003EE008F7